MPHPIAPRPVALTGTPGTGKSTVAAFLAPRLRAVEVADLAFAQGAARRARGGTEVDLPRLRRKLRPTPTLSGIDFVVGHLAHLLPLRDVIVLRCHPEELMGRLRRARRGSPDDRRANYVAEATDQVLLEAVRPGHRVWEVDTTGRSIPAVARTVRERFRRRGPSIYGTVDWLADPRVTEHLLDRGP